MITRPTYAVFLALLASSFGCPDKIDFNDSAATGDPTGLTSATGSSSTGTTTGGVSTVDPTQEASTVPPETSATGDTSSTTGSDCVQGDLECAAGVRPYLLRCVDGQFKPALPGDAYDAGDCDGFCIDNSGGVSAASGCADGACACNTSCTTTSATYFCRDADLIGWCYAGQTYQASCAQECQVSGAASGTCDTVVHVDGSRDEWCRCPCTESWCGEGCPDCACTADGSYCLPPIYY